MVKTAIITDSTAYIPKELRDEHNITMIPLNIIFGQESYKEEVEITSKQFYEEMKSKDKCPTTSQPAISLFLDAYQELSQNYEEIIVITLSSGISGTYATASNAVKMIEGTTKIHIFDAEISCMLQGFYVLEAAKLAEEGVSSEEILKQLKTLRENTQAYFIAHDLSHLHLGGYLNGAQLFLGNMLNIKHVLHFNNKAIVPFENVRTEEKAMNLILSLLENDAKDGSQIDITVIHAHRYEKANNMAIVLREKYPHANIVVSYFGPVIGTHLGEGSMGIGWVKHSNLFGRK